MKTIDEQIKSKNLTSLHLIFGEERYMVRYRKKSIIKSLDMEENKMNFSYFEGDAIDISELVDIAQTLPFLAEKRLVIVENSGFFEKANDFVDYMPEIPDTTCLVFLEKKVDKRNRLYKYITKNGLVTEEKEADQKTLLKWIGGYLKGAGKSITQNTAVGILNKVGMNMELLSTELEKVIAYTGNREVVEMTDVEAVCTTHITNRIFEMLDAVSMKQQKKAIHLYHDLLSLKEPPARIMYLFARQVNMMLQVTELRKRGLNNNDIAKRAGVPPFAVGKYISEGNNYTRKQLLDMLSECAKNEEAIKTGRLIDQMAVEVFLIQYSSR